MTRFITHSKYRSAKSFSALILFLILSLSCSNQEDPTPSDSKATAPTQSFSQTASLLTPTLASTLLPANEVSPIPLLSATPESSIVPATRSTGETSPSQPPTEATIPTRFSTPSYPADEFELKEWTDVEALDIVHKMREQIDPVDWDSELSYGTEIYRYQVSHRPLEVVAREGFHRFPNSQYKDEFLWNQAVAVALRDLPKEYPDELIIALLQDGLAQGFYNPDDWQSNYEIFDFVINQAFTASNLLGDGQTIPIFKIETMASNGDDGLFFGLMEDASEYHVFPITSFWHEGNGYWFGEPELEDHTKDGLPELIAPSRFHSGSICLAHLSSLQWNGDNFVNLMEQPDGNTINLHTCIDRWAFEENEGEIPDNIIVYESLWLWDGLSPQQRIYAWNGSAYQLVNTVVYPPEEDNQLILIEYDIYQKAYGPAAESIDQLLSLWQTNRPENIDPSFPDYLRFKQAWLYALNGQFSRSQESFQFLIDEPVNPITPTLSVAAQSFLEQYQSDNNLYKACLAAQEAMLTALNNSSSMRSDFLRAWGYSRNGFPCDLDVALQSLLKQAVHLQPQDGLQFLEMAGVNILEKRQVDINQDEVSEWLFNIQAPDPYGWMRTEHWAVYETNGQIQFSKLGLISTTFDKWEVVFPPNVDYPIHLVQTDESLRVVRFAITDDSLEEKYYFRSELTFNVDGFSILEQADGLEFEVKFSESSFNLQTISFRWDPNIEDFEVVSTNIPHFAGTSVYEVIDKAKELIFEEARYEDAIALLSEFQKHYKDEYPTEVKYLLGLAFELSGLTDEAVEIYWQLWRDYPDSPYAIIVQQRLEM